MTARPVNLTIYRLSKDVSIQSRDASLTVFRASQLIHSDLQISGQTDAVEFQETLQGMLLDTIPSPVHFLGHIFLRSETDLGRLIGLLNEERNL